MHPVGFTKEARRDILEFVPDTDDQDVLVVAIVESLRAFPRAHHKCPPSFGPRARYYVESSFTVIFDVEGSDPSEKVGAQVVVRHVWPSRSEQVSRLATALLR